MRQTVGRKLAEQDPVASRGDREVGREPDSLDARPADSKPRWGVVAALVAAGVIVAWAAANLLAQGNGFAVLVPPKLHGGTEAASALVRFFAALVLGLFLAEGAGWRMRWVVCGLAALGVGHLIFGYLEPLIQNDPPEFNEALYESFVAETIACALFAIGLFPGTPPRPLVRAATIIPAILLFGYLFVFEIFGGDDWMPPMAHVESAEEAVKLGTPLVWLTPLHWILSAIPVVLGLAAVVGAFWQARRGVLRGWLLFAMVLLAGSVLHDYLWPSAYGGEVLTTADVLSLAFAATVAFGGVAELRRVARERTALLASERERVRRLDELAALRADFSAMVAHELDGPIAAIRKLNEMLSAEGSNSGLRGYATNTIEGEIDVLNALVADVRAAAAVERDDFDVELRPLPLAALLAEAEAYANTLPGDHPVSVSLTDAIDAQQAVRADPERVGQVLRNLLSNAAKYSPEGAPIRIRLTPRAGRIRIEVVDAGWGIHPDDLARIFEKFGRGRDREGHKVAGVGLGLYLSRRIVQSHGSELTVQTGSGEGSTFGFELEMAR